MSGGISATSAISLGLAAASTAATVAGKISEGQAGAASAASSAAASRYQAQVAENNRQIAEQNAQYAMAAGQTQAANTSLRGAAQVSALKAKQGASGISVNAGTAVDVRAGARQANQVDSETVLNNAQRQAYGYRVQGEGYGAQAGLDQQQASNFDRAGANASTAGFVGAGGSLLSGASSILGSWPKGGGGDTSYLLPTSMDPLGGGLS